MTERKTVGDLIGELLCEDRHAPVCIAGESFLYSAGDVTVLPSGAVCLNLDRPVRDDGSPE